MRAVASLEVNLAEEPNTLAPWSIVTQSFEAVAVAADDLPETGFGPITNAGAQS